MAGPIAHPGWMASGRLATLHAYDIVTHTWNKLADAYVQPRGGDRPPCSRSRTRLGPSRSRSCIMVQGTPRRSDTLVLVSFGTTHGCSSPPPPHRPRACDARRRSTEHQTMFRVTQATPHVNPAAPTRRMCARGKPRILVTKDGQFTRVT